MAVTSGTVHSVCTIKSGYASASSIVQVAEILFTVAGTYAQADNSILTGVAALITASRRNGRVITLLGACPSQNGSSQADPSIYLGLKTVAVASADVTFEITLSSATAEYTDATALPTFDRPLGICVAFTES